MHDLDRFVDAPVAPVRKLIVVHNELLACEKSLLWRSFDVSQNFEEPAEATLTCVSGQAHHFVPDFCGFRSHYLHTSLRHTFKPVEQIELRTGGARTNQYVGVELEDKIASWEIGGARRNPIMREIRACKGQVPCFKRADIVSHIGEALRVGNVVNFPLGVVIPDADRIWIVIPTDQERSVDWQNDLLSCCGESVREGMWII